MWRVGQRVRSEEWFNLRDCPEEGKLKIKTQSS
jgi:hypothetical protein